MKKMIFAFLGLAIVASALHVIARQQTISSASTQRCGGGCPCDGDRDTDHDKKN